MAFGDYRDDDDLDIVDEEEDDRLAELEAELRAVQEDPTPASPLQTFTDQGWEEAVQDKTGATSPLRTALQEDEFSRLERFTPESKAYPGLSSLPDLAITSAVDKHDDPRYLDPGFMPDQSLTRPEVQPGGAQASGQRAMDLSNGPAATGPSGASLEAGGGLTAPTPQPTPQQPERPAASEEEALRRAERRTGIAGLIGALAGGAGLLGGALKGGDKGLIAGMAAGQAGLGIAKGGEEVRNQRLEALQRAISRKDKERQEGRADRSMDLQERAIVGREDIARLGQSQRQKEFEAKNQRALEAHEANLSVLRRREDLESRDSEGTMAMKSGLETLRASLGRDPLSPEAMAGMTGRQAEEMYRELIHGEGKERRARIMSGNGRLGGGAGAPDKMTLRKLKEAAASAGVLDGMLREMAELSKKVSESGPLRGAATRAMAEVGVDSSETGRMRALISRMKLQLKELDGLGILSKTDFDLLNEQIPAMNSPSEIFSGPLRYDTMRDILGGAVRTRAQAAGIEAPDLEEMSAGALSPERTPLATRVQELKEEGLEEDAAMEKLRTEGYFE